MTVIMDYVSASTQTAVIGYTLYNIGRLTYARCFGRRAALITQAERMVQKIVDELDNGAEYEIDDVTAVVAPNTMDAVDIKTSVKRRVKAKAPFRSWLVKVGKAKFGLPSRTEANRMCVRKYLYDQCIDHGVLARHIWENVDFATEIVFLPTSTEMVTAALQHSKIVKNNKRMYASFGSPTQKVA